METELIATIVGIMVLLVLSGFFSGSETALTAASEPRMHLLERQGDKRAKMVTELLGNKERMIGAILLGNNLVNILASALATSVLITLFGDHGVVYATAVMTLLVLVFGEIAPKTYAFYHSDRIALAIAPVFRVLVSILSPITRVINGAIAWTMRLFGVDFAGIPENSQSVEALRGAAAGRRSMAGALAAQWLHFSGHGEAREAWETRLLLADGDLEVLQIAAGVVSGAQFNAFRVHLFENTRL